MKKYISLFLLGLLIFPALAFSATQDLVLSPENVRIPETALEGKSVQFYATIKSNSSRDHRGIVRFFTGGKQLGADQPFSVVAGESDTVFISAALPVGSYTVLVRLFPFDATDDNPDNNSVQKTFRVLGDADRDGKPDETDTDDDNDGVPDTEDAFPLDRKEWKDTDGDGKGDNADTDDDNDGIPDTTDCAPLDATLGADSDGDGVCDEQDAFPDDPAETSDYDHDGIGDNADQDADNDGIPKGEDVNDTNRGPIINVNGLPTFPTTKESFVLDFSGTKDPDGEVTQISAKLKIPNNEQPILLAITEQNTYELLPPVTGKYELLVEAKDDDGETRSDTVDFTVRSRSYLTAIGFFVIVVVALAIYGVIAYSSKRALPPKQQEKKAPTRKRKRKKARK